MCVRYYIIIIIRLHSVYTLKQNYSGQSWLLFMISLGQTTKIKINITHGRCWYAWYIQNQHKLCHHIFLILYFILLYFSVSFKIYLVEIVIQLNFSNLIFYIYTISPHKKSQITGLPAQPMHPQMHCTIHHTGYNYSYTPHGERCTLVFHRLTNLLLPNIHLFSPHQHVESLKILFIGT